MIELRVHDNMADVPRESWDALLAPDVPPFLSHTFLDALERAGCVTPDCGWLPMHMTLWEGKQMIGAAPAYLKGHSEGEFVFDYGWADFASRLHIKYYPKLVLAVPFTPATGSRLLVKDEAERRRLAFALAEGVRRVVDAQSISSAHVLFLPASQAAELDRAGFAQRWGMQYHWNNQGYTTFEDFLQTFPSKKRTQIRRERREMERQGIRIATLRGREITSEAVEAMHAFYELTVDKFRWGRRYLNRAFFYDICERMSGNVEIVLARDGAGKILAGAFNISGANALFGRYWGAVEERPFLHFNVCYYHSIDECIARKVARFEPGAGGEHKRARGFVPTLTYSAHHLVDARLSGAVREYLGREREHM
ncbi:MAG TPA: GNAT family N-acetyltransferase, partial [Polyangiaceae bacterium]|nr:GNAT family N-acetyltransferase [Polyangiaceae bacterium]